MAKGKGTNVGTAFVTIMPSMKGFGPAVNKGLGGFGFDGLGANMGGLFASGFGAGLMGAIGGIAAKATEVVGSAIAGSMDAAIARVDILNAYPRVMQNLGYSAEDASASISAIDEHLQGLPTSIDAMAGSVQNLAPMFGDLDEATEVALAMNDALVAGGQSVQVQEAALQQYTQMLAKGKPELQDWRSLQQAMPGQLDQIAKSLLGPTANAMDLYDALQDGTVTMDQFNDTLVSLDQNGANGFASFEQQARDATGGIQTQLTNLRTAITRNLANIIQTLQPYIQPAVDWLKGVIDGIGAWLTEFSQTVLDNIDFEAFAASFQTLKDAWGEGFGDGGDDAKTWGEAVADAINKLPDLIEKLAPLVRGLGHAFRFLTDHAEQVAKYLPIIVIAMRGMQIAKMVAPFVSALAQKGIKPLGKEAAMSAKQMLSFAVVLLAMGAAVLMCAAGFWIMAQAAVAIAEAGPLAFASFALMLGGIAALMFVASRLGAQMTAGAIGLIAFGAAIILVSIGFGIMAQAAVALAGAGTAAMVVFGLMFVGMAGLMVLVAALGPALIVGSIGFLILAAGMVVMAEAASIVIDAIIDLIDCIAENAEQINSIITTVSDSVNSFVTTVTDGVTSIIDSVSNLATSVGDAVSGVLDSLAGVFDSIGNGALNAGTGVSMMADALIRLTNDTGLGDLGASTGAAADGIHDMVNAASGSESLQAVATSVRTMAMFGQLAGSSLMLVGVGLSMVSALAGAASAGVQTFAGGVQGSTGSLAAAAAAIRTFAASQIVIAVFGRQAAQTFKKFGTDAVQASTQAVTAFRAAMSAISASVSGAQLRMARIQLAPMPHFRFVGEFNPQTRAVPTIAVDWYATGAVFDRPSIVGVGDSARPEIITPQDMMARTFASELSGSGIREEVHALREDVRNMKLYLDGSTLVGGIADRMDTALGQRRYSTARGF